LNHRHPSEKNPGQPRLPFKWGIEFLFYEFGSNPGFQQWLQGQAPVQLQRELGAQRPFTRLVPDSDRHNFSVGIGHQYKKKSNGTPPYHSPTARDATQEQHARGQRGRHGQLHIH